MRRINIGNKWVGPNDPCFIIAEAGANANSDPILAENLIIKAAESGADAIKFQSYSAENLVTKTAPKYYVDNMDEFLNNARPKGFQIDEFKQLDSLPKSVYFNLVKLAKELNIIFLSTPFDKENVDFLEELNVPAYKIASADITYHEFLRYVAKKNRSIILSTGASTLNEVKEAVEIIEETGNKQIIILHCILSYPTKYEDANLNMMQTLQKEFPDIAIGLSDHSLGTLVPSLSVMLGAKVIEKHFTIDKSLSMSTDHFMSVDPPELKRMVQDIRNAELSKGRADKIPVAAEHDAVSYARRSLVASRDIKKGTVLTREMIVCKRPGTGISPKFLVDALNKKVKLDINEDTVITWGMLGGK
ncbi:hypothetical protein A2230_08380 [candidate division WOR-1 bacterium RIFOXYA2_FULL_36_21]|uniref:AFP-like domain-containing protein n=1 Tax=candidate division WOR-1 bacterium RIFOXYB2_FULL_36_35 TaxID=1802578 RepID=A0A1F4S8F1_UNCSA|nr:MAG: hypothetical protein A2230_08380 [candidate division WOR-1 bacterium RIFOXYA2_FULL_36_21]OGC15325.1 MAG: hypothetical protein A2282_06130 [candidate division WOR-1 bacterium RIFOXYA12_FULL_36_13]OGC16667.1 MAG: hypothetical protein A2290_03595 [candidate division WOR-1 bacterium RIFOXYB2_FULL_36_35]